MGWVSLMEDVMERFDEAAFLLGVPGLSPAGLRVPAREATETEVERARKSVGELRVILRGLKVQLEEALDYLTDPSTPALDLNPAALCGLKTENQRLTANLARERAERESLGSELRKAQVKLVGSTVQARESAEKLEFLSAMGGRRILESRRKKAGR